MDTVYPSPMNQKLEKIYYIYHHKKGEWAIYLNGENKIGVKRDAKKLPKITFFLDSDIIYDKYNDDGLPTEPERDNNTVWRISGSLTPAPKLRVKKLL